MKACESCRALPSTDARRSRLTFSDPSTLRLSSRVAGYPTYRKLLQKTTQSHGSVPLPYLDQPSQPAARRQSTRAMPAGRPGRSSPEPVIPLLPFGSRQPAASRRDSYGELESSANADAPTARSRAGSRVQLGGLGRVLGRSSGDGRESWLQPGSLAPLLVGLTCGVLGTWILYVESGMRTAPVIACCEGSS